MSGESPPNMPGRFTGLSNNNKKYPGTPKSPLLSNNATGGNRNAQARARFMTGKLSAPLPINLPSLRREHAVGTDIPAAGSPSAPNHGWGSSSSPFTSPKQSEIKPEEVASETTKKTLDQQSESTSDDHTSPTSPTSNVETAAPTVRAWAAPSTVQHNIKPPSSEFPTAAEAVAGKSNEKDEELDEDDKDYLKFIMSDPNHKSWDEMVAEDFEDDFTETMELEEPNQQSENNETVSPSERFTEDYDRSYPPQLKQTRDNDSYKHFRRNDDSYRYNYDGSNSRRYSSSEGGGNERRHSNDRWNNNSSNHRRDSMEQKNNNNSNTSNNTSWQRRPSYDRKAPYQPTLLQRNRRMSEQSARSDHSREDHAPPSASSAASSEQNPLQIIPEPDTPQENTAEITAVQREVMMTAAERAKKRRDEEEAEYEAARERARQKAAALALKEEEKTKPEEPATVEIKKKDKEIKEILKPEAPPCLSPKDDEKTPTTPPSTTTVDVSKPWNLVAAKKDQQEKPSKPSTPEDEPKLSESSTTNTSSKASSALTEDEQNWEKHVKEIRRNSLELKPTKAVTANDWTQYADRLREKSHPKNTSKKSDDSSVQVEVIDFQKNKAWGEIPSNITRGRDRRNEGWVIADEEDHGRSHGRGRGRKTSNSSHSSSTHQRRKLSDATDTWRQYPAKEPVVLEILKHTPPRPSSPPIVPVATIPEKVEEPECPKQKSASKISNLLHESSSPIFPSSIERLVGKKPSNISFMIDTVESDEEITMSHTANGYQKSDTLQDEHIEPSEGEDTKITDNTTTPSDSGESSPSTSPAVSHGHKMEGPEMKRMAPNPNFPALIYQFKSSTLQGGGDGSSPPSLHGHVTRADGIYLSPPQCLPGQQLPGHQYLVPYPQAGTGNMQPIYFPTVSWQLGQMQQMQQQQQIQQRYAHHHSHRTYYDNSNNRPSYRSNRYNDEDGKYHSTADGYSRRGTHRKRGQYSTSRGRGHASSSFYKKNTEFEQPSSTQVQDP